MKAIQLQDRALSTALAVRKLLSETSAKAAAIREEANDALAALQLASQVELNALWATLAREACLTEDELRQYNLDFNYIDDLGVMFLRPSGNPADTIPSADSTAMPNPGTLQ